MPTSTQRTSTERKARIAARLWLRGERSALSLRDKRLARWLGHDPEVTNEAIGAVAREVELEFFVRIWTTARVLPKPVLIRR